MNNNLEGMKTRLQKAEDEISKHTQKIKDKYKIKHRNRQHKGTLLRGGQNEP